MAVLKHIKSRNSDYGKALEYLLFQHNEETSRPLRDDAGRMVLREEYYIDGLNCDPMSFDRECEQVNAAFRKNQRWNEIKSHHYIISFDPKDRKECGLTGERAQALCLDFARKNFPGYQALVVTHTDGHNGSGNIHTHIVINSVRMIDAPREDYMDQLNDHRAGYKHRQTKQLLHHLQKELMDMCEREGLHQVDLLNPAPVKITNEEYRAEQRGQKKLDQLNQDIIAAGMQPTQTRYQTQKQFLRDAIDDVSGSATSFEEFQQMLLEKYKISVSEKRGRYSYLHPDRSKAITGKALGTRYDRAELCLRFETQLDRVNHQSQEEPQKEYDPTYDYQADPVAIFFIRSDLRLVVDLQNNVKAKYNLAYARKVEISNLQQMANTVIYVQEHGYSTQDDLQAKLSEVSDQLAQAKSDLSSINQELKNNREEMHFTRQYLATKKTYAQMLKAKNKKKFRNEHPEDIAAYEEARKYLRSKNPDGHFASYQSLKEKQEELLRKQEPIKQRVKYYKDYQSELRTVNSNIDAILDQPASRRHEKTKEEEIT